MISIKNTQRKIEFPVKAYHEKAQKILDYLGYGDFDLGILLTTDKTIQKYNRDYRSKDTPTDVLSFPYHDNLKAGKKIKVTCDEDKNLGDIIISVSYVFENKKNLEGDFNSRMDLMLVHAICHLLGHDHIEDADFKKMKTLENKLMKVIA
ncbi:MAG: rRNA maturation RNase YbeY [Candidatus Dependentiae bacterium]|nr:rRNA maturation RNase YbeY [Candidatus Dependentiae bacterium]